MKTLLRTAMLGVLLALSNAEETMSGQSHPYVGMWVTADGYVRHELLPNGRYDEARGDRESAYRGRYEVTGDHIEYWDDTGFLPMVTSSTACSTTGA